MMATPATLLAGTVPTILPVLGRPYRRVLDLGCGSNRTLSELALDAAAVRIGVDVAVPVLQSAQRQIPNVRYAAADAHALPFPKDWFDLVIAKVALPYTHIPSALRELHRVLCAGGCLWITLHPFRMALASLLQELRAGRLGNAAFRAYVIANGLLFDFTGREVRFPLTHGRIESCQSVRGITRALTSAGFTDVQFEMRRRGAGHAADDRRYGPVFAVAARKAAAARA
ncbi:MAG: class I SAM-dependent methyltransferase [Gemmatimonadales bacterium]